MKLLLDTHLLLWAALEPRKLSQVAQRLLSDAENKLMFSPASIWEVAIERALGRDHFQTDPRQLKRGLLDDGYAELPITSEHTIQVEELPKLHKDRFDRILLAQAIVDGITLLTTDAVLARYAGPVRKV